MPEPIQADLAGRICVVTGASAGIGQATALELARLGARVVMAVRDPDRGEAARRRILGATGRSAVELALVDLSSQRSIRAFARDLSQRLPRIDVLVNNAGIWTNRRALGPDGIELTWATNVLGYFLATELLRPLLEKAGRARVVNVASRLAGELDLADVGFERRAYDGRKAYAQSKQADRLRSTRASSPPRSSARAAGSSASGPRCTRSCGPGGPSRAPTRSSTSRPAPRRRGARASSGTTARRGAAASGARSRRRRSSPCASG